MKVVFKPDGNLPRLSCLVITLSLSLDAQLDDTLQLAVLLPQQKQDTKPGCGDLQVARFEESTEVEGAVP